MTETVVSCAWDMGAQLGEGPVWMAAEQAVYFVDIQGRQVHRLGLDGQQKSWPAPQSIGFVQPLARGGFVAGLKSGLHRFSPETGDFKPLLAPEPQLPGNRLNDAHVDAAGRLWFGSMDDAHKKPTGSLYSLPDAARPGTLRRHDTGIVITNGPATSPDGKRLYHTDTLAQTVHVFDLSADGTLSNKRLFLQTSGTPDGSAVDAEGGLWVCYFGGWRAERYMPNGNLVQTVHLPCANVTKLAFGGPDLRTAYVTTAGGGLSDAQRNAQPQAGGLFSFRVDVPGLPQQRVKESAAS